MKRVRKTRNIGNINEWKMHVNLNLSATLIISIFFCILGTINNTISIFYKKELSIEAFQIFKIYFIAQ